MGNPSETFAHYLAKHYVARKGFRPGTVPEAAALANACDIVLTNADGMSFTIVCIVDREADPRKTFGMAPSEVEAIGKACLKYTGKVSSSRMPASIQVIEVSSGAPASQDLARLKAMKRSSITSKAILSSWTLDTSSGAVWTNAPLGGWLVGKRALEKLLRAPRVADADLAQPQVTLARKRFPLLTLAMIAVLAAVFACEIVFGVEPWSGMLAPSVKTLVALGGLNRGLVLEGGEWSRVFSAALLHADAIHLVLNCVCLYLAGAVLESFVGRRWFLALFLLGAVCGSLLSLALNPPSVVSVGASGAIMGLLAAAFVCSFRYPHGGLRIQVQITTMQVLIPSLLPLAVSRTGAHVDFAAHLGGALSGAAVGLLMLKTWLPSSPRPAFLPLAAAVCIAGTAALAWSAVPPVRGYHAFTLDGLLIPPSQLPQSNEDARAKAGDLVARYPRDPRARLFHANSLIGANDLAGAEREVRAALAEQEILRTKFKPEFEARLQTLLALVLSDRNQRAEAKAAAQPVCATSAPTLAPMRELLGKARLCEK